MNEDADLTTPADLRFTRLKLQNWRNFPNLEMRLAKRCFLVGPNASGKSNLLDAFRFLADLGSIGGGLQAAVWRRNGVKSIRSLSARTKPEVIVEVDVGTDVEPERWTYSLHLAANRLHGFPRVVKEVVRLKGKVIRNRPDDKDNTDPIQLTQTLLEQVSANQEFRELAKFLTSIRYLHLVPQLIRSGGLGIIWQLDIFGGNPFDPYGADFIDVLARTPKPDREEKLGKILTALKVSVPQLEALEIKKDTRGQWHLAGKYTHWRPNGAWQTEESFSDGTLRLIGLLWAVLEEGGPLLLEEPELSLHAAVVRNLPPMFAHLQSGRSRQILCSTHAETLLADGGIGLDEVFLLHPVAEGTEVTPATFINDVHALLEGGLTLGEIVISKTSPPYRLAQLGKDGGEGSNDD